MIKTILRMAMLTALLWPGVALAANNPQARPEAVVTVGNARFTVLTPEMLRIEYSQEAKFEDKATFAIVNRNLDVPWFSTDRDDRYFLSRHRETAPEIPHGQRPARQQL